MVGTACCAASMTASPQPSLRDGSTCTQLRCSTSCLVRSSTWPWKVTASVMPSRAAWATSAVPTSRRRGRRDAGPASAAAARRPRRARPRSACAAPAATARRCSACPTAAAVSVSAGASSRPLRTTAMWPGVTPRSVRSRADGSDTVTYWLRAVHPRRQPRLDEPADPAEHRPATGHCSRWQWWTSTTTRLPNASAGQERDAVLGVDHHVGPRPRSGPRPTRAATIANTAQDVDGVAAAAAADRAPRRAPRGARRPGSARCAA